jgi:hypothetical protein
VSAFEVNLTDDWMCLGSSIGRDAEVDAGARCYEREDQGESGED